MNGSRNRYSIILPVVTNNNQQQQIKLTKQVLWYVPRLCECVLLIQYERVVDFICVATMFVDGKTQCRFTDTTVDYFF
jgi:hypothetical protein